MARNIMFSQFAWDDYLHWESNDRKTLKKVNRLIEDVSRNGNEGMGKPEPLVGQLSGYWSRRITDKDRLVYKVDNATVYIIGCRGHYGDK